MTDNYPTTMRNHPKDVLAGLHRILSSSRGGNKRLLSLLNAKLAGADPDLRILAPPAVHEVVAGPEPGWPAYAEEEDPDYHSLEQQMAQMSWPPLEMGRLMRSPSPLTRMLLESPEGMLGL